MPNAQDPYGSYGNLYSRVNLQGSGPSGRFLSGDAANPGADLPAWLASQFRQQNYNTGGDGGQDYTGWAIDSAGGGAMFRDQSGNQRVQIGDPKTFGSKDPNTWLKNRNAVTYDPNTGYTTDPANIGSRTAPWAQTGLPMLLAVLGGGAALSGGLGAMFGGAADTGTSVAGTGAFDMEGVTPSLYGGGVEPFAGASGSVGSGADAFAGAEAGAEGNTGLSFNNLRQLNSARSLISSLTGGTSRSTGGGMPGSSGIDISSILGILGLGHQAFGGGIGTASGAIDNGREAAGLADPWASHRAPFQAAVDANGLDMLGIGKSPADAITSNPAYQFERDQGMKAINMGDAAQGTLRSGNRLAELQKYGTGLASTFWDSNAANSRANLGALGTLAGVGAGSPAAAGQMLMGGFDNASNLRNAGQNGLFSGGSANGILGMLGQGASGISGLLSRLFSSGGNGGFDMSTVDFGNLPAFNDTSGFNPQDFGAGDVTGGIADATGAWF